MNNTIGTDEIMEVSEDLVEETANSGKGVVFLVLLAAAAIGAATYEGGKWVVRRIFSKKAAKKQESLEMVEETETVEEFDEK